jgi:hypothetical protein
MDMGRQALSRARPVTRLRLRHVLKIFVSLRATGMRHPASILHALEELVVLFKVPGFLSSSAH